MAPNKSVLCIDAAGDKETRYVHAFRQNRIYQDTLIVNNWSLTELSGSDANETDCNDALTNDPPAYITGSAHGYSDQFLDKNVHPIIESSKVQSKQFQDKIIHLLACETGADLGKTMISKGKADAFFGYTSYFEIPYSPTMPHSVPADWEFGKPDPYDPLLDPDAKVCLEMAVKTDLALLNQFDAESTYAEVENYYLDQMGAHPPLPAIVRSCLSHNYRCFVAPTVEEGGTKPWGTERAILQ